MKKKPTDNKHMLSLPAKILYGAGLFPYSILQQTLFPLALLFAVDAMSMPGWLAGIALSMGLLAHAVCDPLARRISDKCASVLFGKRYGFYILGVFLAALANIFLWSMPPAAAAGVKFLWLALSVTVISVLISCMQMPYDALGDELAGDAAERKAIHTVKNLFFIASLAVPLILMGGLLRDSADPAGYMNLALILSGAALIAGTAAFFTTYPHLPRLRAKTMNAEEKQAGGLSLKKLVLHYFSALKAKDGRAVLLGYCTSLMSVAFLSGTGLLFLIHTLRLPIFLAALDMGLLFLAAIGSQFFWPRIARLRGKKHAVLAGVAVALSGILLMCAAFAAAYYFDAGFPPEGLLVPAFAVSGFGLGAVFCVPSAMLAETRKGDPDSPDAAGMLNFFYRTGQAAVVLLSGILISIFNYGGSGGDGGLIRGALGWIVLLGASLALGLSVYLFQTYRKPPKPPKQLRMSDRELRIENGELRSKDREETDGGQTAADGGEQQTDATDASEPFDGQLTIDVLAAETERAEPTDAETEKAEPAEPKSVDAGTDNPEPTEPKSADAET
ncbi:MAG: MFS transporter [Clostridiales bacterium]|jgi:Na+/melibiose symporter-like transporter|nr:MFS transporter [Clostridiales bacterium]